MSNPIDVRDAGQRRAGHDEATAILTDLTSQRFEPEAPCRADVEPDGHSEYPWALAANRIARCAMWL